VPSCAITARSFGRSAFSPTPSLSREIDLTREVASVQRSILSAQDVSAIQAPDPLQPALSDGGSEIAEIMGQSIGMKHGVTRDGILRNL
jgi:hypothetical protein